MFHSSNLCTLLLALLLCSCTQGADIRCCRQCATSTDCSDIGDYLGEDITESAERFCTGTLTGALGQQYSVCDPGTTNPGEGVEMCCDPSKECGVGFCILVLGPGGSAWCDGFGIICPMMEPASDTPSISPSKAPSPSPNLEPSRVPTISPTRASVTPPTGAPAPGPAPEPEGPAPAPPGCFSESVTVEVLGRGMVELKDLQVGEKIRVLGSDHRPVYESVYGFGHREPDTIAPYLRIITSNTVADKTPLEVTGDHLLFVGNPVIRQEPRAVRADSVQVGDRLVLAASKEEDVIVRIDYVQRQGLYQPLTPSGTLMASGIHASAYVSIAHSAPRVVEAVITTSLLSEHTFFHGWMAPYQFVCSHVAPGICEDDYDKEKGFIHWLVLGQNLARIAETLPTGLRLLGLVMVGLFCGVFVVLNAAMKGELSWWLLLLGLGFGFAWRMHVRRQGESKIGRQSS